MVLSCASFIVLRGMNQHFNFAFAVRKLLGWFITFQTFKLHHNCPSDQLIASMRPSVSPQTHGILGSSPRPRPLLSPITQPFTIRNFCLSCHVSPWETVSSWPGPAACRAIRRRDAAWGEGTCWETAFYWKFH